MRVTKVELVIAAKVLGVTFPKLMSLGRDPELPRACLNRGPKKRLNCPGWE